MNTDQNSKEFTLICYCECGDFECQRTFSILISTYKAAITRGWVRHVECSYTDEDVELERYENFVIWGKP